MRVVIQRVSKATVSIDNSIVGQIRRGFVVLVGICENDSEKDVEYIAKKVAQMRILSDDEGKMNLSLTDVKDAAILSISQFTLYSDCKHGNRPSFINAARPEKAEPLYELFNKLLKEKYMLHVETGRFGANMQISLINDGPVTIVLDSL